MTNGNQRSSNEQGIQDLIDMLKAEGVASGKEEGLKIVSDAEARAAWLVEQAEIEAEQIRNKAREEANFTKSAGQEALNVAYRDLKLRLKDELINQFARQLKALIQHEMTQPETLKLLMYAAASQTSLPDGNIDLCIDPELLSSSATLLPENAPGLDELRKHPQALKSGPLLEMLSSVTRALLLEGVQFKTGKTDKYGIVFSLTDKDIQVEVSDESISELLLTHLQPRFRAILEGVVT